MTARRLTAIHQAIQIVNGLDTHADEAIYLTCSCCRQMLIRAFAAAIQCERPSRRGAGRRKTQQSTSADAVQARTGADQ